MQATDNTFQQDGRSCQGGMPTERHLGRRCEPAQYEVLAMRKHIAVVARGPCWRVVWVLWQAKGSRQEVQGGKGGKVKQAYSLPRVGGVSPRRKDRAAGKLQHISSFVASSDDQAPLFSLQCPPPPTADLMDDAVWATMTLCQAGLA
eukprot:366037-Chlamydomonas_euryale.AAC.3